MTRIDWNRFVYLLLPTFLRYAEIIAWIKALISPIIVIYDDLIANYERNYYTGTKYQIKYGSQVCHLKKILNDACDNIQRRITIGDVEFQSPVNLYTEDELFEVGLYKESETIAETLYTQQEVGDEGYDFKVLVPADVWSSQANKTLIRALLNKNKLVSKLYIIEVI